MDIVGIGLANIDLVAHVRDDFLKLHKVPKGDAVKMNDLSFARLRSDLPHFDAIPGGGTANTLCGMAAYGVTARFFGKIGEDSFESLYRSSFNEYTVEYDTKAGRQESSQCAVLVTPDGERSFAYTQGASWDLEVEDLDVVVMTQSRMILVDSYIFKYGRDSLVAKCAFETAQNNKIPLIMKVKEDEFIRPYAQKIKALADARVLDLLVGNHENLPLITGTIDIDDALNVLKGWKCDILMTLNKNGTYYISNGLVQKFSTDPVPNPKNTTGAGDQFLAGFLLGRLDHKPVSECMEFGASCARSILMHDTARPPLVNRHSIRF